MAARLGMTVGELDSRMSAHELMEWLALENIAAEASADAEARADLAAAATADAAAIAAKLKGR